MSKAFLTGAARKASTESESIDLLNLLTAFRNGSIEARNAIIRAHYAIICNIARKCAGSSPYSDDICSEALLQLTKAVELAKTNLTHDNLTGYIIKSVCGGLKTARFRLERGLLKPPSTYSSQKARGQNTTVLLPPEPSKFHGLARRENPSLEFLEILDSIAHTDRERKIIDLRKQGYSYEEIADIIDLSPSMVGLLMAKLTERFDKVYS